ncbi:hypothetical protein [Sphingobium bisphenolivorans]|uniref:hypothetical protein n=1 Tax=Sphingobium bisphenolivorans TaxID=1335760 RepID=UPI0003A95539|nr:hypothetical protein [Sphingobium bisphenolivorans]
MKDPRQPSSRRLGRAAIVIVVIVLAMFVLVFVGRNVWHGEELHEDQATGNNMATEHTGPNFNQKP